MTLFTTNVRKPSAFLGVSYLSSSMNGVPTDKPWKMEIMTAGKKTIKRFATEREAAKAYDLERIKVGKEPVNILKRKAP